MKEIKEEKNCLNCEFFSQHYSKITVKFMPVYCGVCKHGYVKEVDKNKVLFGCKHWRDASIKKKEQRESIEKILYSISKQLNEIADVLVQESSGKDVL